MSGRPQVQEVQGRSGVRAYLVQDDTLPFFSMSFAFHAGTAYDPAGREGLGNMAASLLDEGAGARDSGAFQRAVEDNAIRLSFSASRDQLSGNFRTLDDSRDLAVDLLRDALMRPRFDPEPVARVRGQTAADLKRLEASPSYVAQRAWFELAFAGHPYARPTRGDAASLEAIEADDLRAWAASMPARDGLTIGASGAIDAPALASVLDRAFGDLPATSAQAPLPAVTPAAGPLTIVARPLPQSVVTFGHAGIDRQDPDYMAAMIVNYVLGGGGFASRLMQEVREKRGLAYGVSSSLLQTTASPLWVGGVATNNEQVGQSLAIVREESRKLAAGEIEAEELGHAKTYLTGSFPLRLTSNDQLARMLETMMDQKLGADHLERRNQQVEAVTLDDVRRVAARLLSPELLVTVVGAPVGLDA